MVLEITIVIVPQVFCWLARIVIRYCRRQQQVNFILWQRILFFKYTVLLTIAWSPCSSNPCMNSGVCTVNQFSNTFTCTCSNSHYGNQCERMYICTLVNNSCAYLIRYESMLYTSTLSKWWYMFPRSRQHI